MSLRLILDQNTERQLSEKLRKAGHDVERVVTVPELGEGAEDEEILSYAEQHDRIVVTYDSDFTTVSPDAHAGVFFIPDQRLSSYEVFSIIQAVDGYYGSHDAMRPVVFLTTDWR